MELRQIKYFIEVAKREHVSEAAHALHVAQSAISKQIDNLEKELGVDLFFREGRNIRLTPIGKVFLENMELAMNVIDKARRQIEEYIDPEKGTIRIGYPSSLANYTLPTVISAFREKYPLVKYELHQEAYHDLIESVKKGDIDIAFLGPVPANDKKVKGEPLFTENIVAILPITHPLAKRKELRLKELKDDSFVLFPKGYILRELIDKACLNIGFNPNVTFEGKDIDAIKGLVSAGLGVSLIPEITLIDNLPRDTVMVPISEPKVTRSVGMITPTNRELLPTEKIFCQFIKDFFNTVDHLQK